MKIFFSLFCITFCGIYSFAQENEKLWKNESFGDKDQSTELVELRDASTKHFRNPDGSITAHIAAGLLHYKEKGKWKTIFHTISPTASGFESVHNSHKTYYPKTSTGNITTVLENGSTIIDMIEMRMFYLLNTGEIVSSSPISSKTGDTRFNELTYSDIYGNGIDLRLTQNTTQRKMDYIIQNRSAINAPENSSFLVFEETVEIPTGWYAELVDNEILLIDASRKLQVKYQKPMFSEAMKPHHHDSDQKIQASTPEEIEGDYAISMKGNLLTILTKVPLNWLLDEGRNFPVTIDPTLDCTPSNTNWWTGYVRTDGTSPTAYTTTANLISANDAMRCGRTNSSLDGTGNYVWSSWVKFPIPNSTSSAFPFPDVCVNDVTIETYQYTSSTGGGSCYVNTYYRKLNSDPSIASDATRLAEIRGGTAYSTFQKNVGNSADNWRSVSVNAGSIVSDITASMAQGWFALGMDTYGTYYDVDNNHYERYYIRPHSHANKPILRINYTPYYQVAFSSSPVTICEGATTAAISVTATNVGCQPWTSGSTPPNSVNMAWWANWQIPAPCNAGWPNDCNPRLTPFAGLAPGASQTVTFNVTPPTTPGTYSVTVDMVRDGVCWFSHNGAPSCGPGNVQHSLNLIVKPSPTANAGPDATISCGGNVQIGASTPTFSATPNAGIPDNNSTGITSTINVANGCPWTANQITSVTVNITHPWNADLEIYLQAPDGTQIALAEDKGGDGNNYNNVTFITGGAALPGGNANLTGNYAPQTAFSALGSGSGMGTWTLRVRDDASGDVGTLTSWSINVPGCTYSWTPATGLSATNISNPIASPTSTQTYTLTTTSNGCSTSDYVTVTVGTASTAATSVTGGGNYCPGNSINLNSSGGTNGTNSVFVWYKGGCNNAFTETWTTQPYPGAYNMTTNSHVNGILSVSPVAVNYGSGPVADPMIDMSGLGSFNPAVHRYVNIRYRVTSGTAGAVELFFYNTHYPFAHGDHHTWAALTSDGSWHIATVDMWQNPHYLADGSNITGWRYDWATNLGCTVELDFIQISQYPMIDENNTTTALEWTPSHPHYPGSGTTTYATAKVDMCGVTSCNSTTVTLPTPSGNLATNNQSATCVVNAGETVHFYHTASGNYISSVTATGGALGSTNATAYVDGSVQLVPACVSPFEQTAVLQRHWVITPTTNGTATVRLPYTSTELNNLMPVSNTSSSPYDLVASAVDLKLSKYSGGAFPASTNVNANPNDNCAVGGTTIHNEVALGSTPVAGVTALYSDFSIPGFSEFWLHGSNNLSPLPVELNSFTAICNQQGNKVNVLWSTASENNSSHFIVERSFDGISWVEIGEQQAAGNSSVLLNYELVDTDSELRLHPTLYYRLIQVDLNGEVKSYSPTTAECNSDFNGMELFPNPAKEQVTVLLHGEFDKDTYIAFYDINGKEMKQVFYNSNNFVYTIDLQNFEPGVYIVRLFDGLTNDQFMRFVKQH